MSSDVSYDSGRREYYLKDFKWNAEKKMLYLGTVFRHGYLPSYFWINGEKYRVYFSLQRDEDLSQTTVYVAKPDDNPDVNIDFSIRAIIPWIRGNQDT